jgi:hypothetical protein
VIDAAAVLEQADREAPIAYCRTCAQDTLPVNNICLWCSTNITTGQVDARAAAIDRSARERARGRHNAAAYRARKRPATHQAPA